MPEVNDPYAPFRIRDYRLFMSGSLAAVIGSQIMIVALQWELYTRGGATDGVLALGYIGLAQVVPRFLLTLPAGHVADRFDRKRIVVAMQAIGVLSALGLAALSYMHGPTWAMLACVALGASASAFGWPARASMLPGIVPPEIFSKAVAWNSTTFQIGCVGGPALGGLLTSQSLIAAYLTYAGCLFVALCMNASMRPQKTVEGHREPVTLKSLAAGLEFVFKTKVILAALTMDLLAVLLGGAEYLFPVFAKDFFHGDAHTLAWLRAAPPLGAMVTAVVLAHLPPMRKAGTTLLWCVAGFGAATMVFGLAPWLGTHGWPWNPLWLALGMLVLTGAFDNISVVVRHTLVQLLPPPYMRGRVNAVNAIFIGMSNELGGLESSLTAFWFGAVRSVVVGGFGTICVVLFAAARWPQLRKIDSLEDVKDSSSMQEQEAGVTADAAK